MFIGFVLVWCCWSALPVLLLDWWAVLHRVPCEGRDVRDDPLVTEQDLRQVLIDMIPIPGQAHAEGDTS